jgi:hypothetical protein
MMSRSLLQQNRLVGVLPLFNEHTSSIHDHSTRLILTLSYLQIPMLPKAPKHYCHSLFVICGQHAQQLKNNSSCRVGSLDSSSDFLRQPCHVPSLYRERKNKHDMNHVLMNRITTHTIGWTMDSFILQPYASWETAATHECNYVFHLRRDLKFPNS